MTERSVTVTTDNDSEIPVMIGVPEGQGHDILEDMATLCEGLCTLIHEAHRMGVKRDFDSLKDCIWHLERGFVDESYKTGTPEDLKDGKLGANGQKSRDDSYGSQNKAN